MRVQSVTDQLVLDEDLVIIGDNATVMPRLPAGAFDVIYFDPPFNTGRAQARRTLAVEADGGGDRIGFAGRRYRTTLLQTLSYDDAFADYLAFLAPRLAVARGLLAGHGTLYFHIDYREAHYCKLLLDEIFGREAFLNEIIWSYDYGAKPRRRWPAKHDTILVYVRTPGEHHFDADAVEREPYMAPGLVSAEKAARGKRPDRRVVSHDRADQRTREDRISHPEARGGTAADGRGLLPPGGLVPGSVRGFGDGRGRLPRARPTVRARRRESGGGRGDACAARVRDAADVRAPTTGARALARLAAYQRHEPHRLELPALPARVRALHQHQVLLGVTNRRD